MKKIIKSIKILKKLTCLVWFQFYKQKTGKTESNRTETKKKTSQTEPNRKY
jgi:hypothetical protein